MNKTDIARIASLSANLRFELVWMVDDDEANSTPASLEIEARLDEAKGNLIEAINLVQDLQRKVWQRAKVGGTSG